MTNYHHFHSTFLECVEVIPVSENQKDEITGLMKAGEHTWNFFEVAIIPDMHCIEDSD